MTGSWTLVKKVAPSKAKTTAKAGKVPRKAPFGTPFNRGTICSELAAWGTDCSITVVRSAPATPAINLVGKAASVTKVAKVVDAVKSVATKARASLKRTIRSADPAPPRSWAAPRKAALAAAAVPPMPAAPQATGKVAKSSDPAPPKIGKVAAVKVTDKKIHKTFKRAATSPPTTPRPAKKPGMSRPMREAVKAATRLAMPNNIVGKIDVEPCVVDADTVDHQGSVDVKPAEGTIPGSFFIATRDIKTCLNEGSVVAHCTSCDWDEPKRSSRGVAKVILESSGLGKPMPLDVIDGHLARQQSGDVTVYTLLTKDVYSAKPTYSSFIKALNSLAKTMVSRGEKDLAIPFIGTGRDRLPLNFVILAIREQLLPMGINVLMVSQSYDEVKEARLILADQTSKKVETHWVEKLQAGLREFSERPKLTWDQVKPERHLAKKLYQNERVLASYKCGTEGNGSLELLVTDFRHAVRGKGAIAVSTSRDWDSPARGKYVPASYLYAECQYPKPVYDDLINSRLSFQRVGEKPIFTLFTKEKEGALPKLVDYRQALHELAIGLRMIDETEITIPALCMDRDSIQYEAGLRSILELICSQGISVRLCTTSKSQFFTMKSILQRESGDANVFKTDRSTPKNWQPRPEDQHNHKCYSCGVIYSHWHRFVNKDHPQFDKQCPNNECPEYHKGNNPTNSQLVESPAADHDTIVFGGDWLQSPKWLKEASVFPAAIETLFESVQRHSPNYAQMLWPNQIPDTTQEEVIQLRRLGYAGAVEKKPVAVKTIDYSQLIGLAAVRPRPAKPTKPVEEEVCRPKVYNVRPQQPVKPGRFAKMSQKETLTYLAISGCDGHYLDTYYRVGGTRRHHKLASRRATEWVRYGWHSDYANRFIHLKVDNEDDEDDVLPPVYPEDSETRVPRAQRAKKSISDEDWMAYFRALDKDLLPKKELTQVKREVRKLGVKVHHLSPKDECTGFDLSGELSSLSSPTVEMAVFDLATHANVRVKVNRPEEITRLSYKAGAVHKVGKMRTFTSKRWLTSGSPIYNSSGHICSFVTQSNGKGVYVLSTATTPIKTESCTGDKCKWCLREALWVKHNPKASRKQKQKSNAASKPRASVQAGPARIDAQAQRLMELKMRSELQSRDVAELVTKVAQVKIGNAKISSGVNAISPNVKVTSIGGGKKKQRKSNKNKGSYDVEGENKPGVITEAVKSVVHVATGGLVTIIIALLCLLPIGAQASCFCGYVSPTIIGGLYNCSLNDSTGSNNYIHSSVLGYNLESFNGLSVDLQNWYAVRNRIASDLAPCHVLVDLERNSFAIEDYEMVYAGGTYDLPTVLLIVAAILLICWLVSPTKRYSTMRPTGSSGGVYKPTVVAKAIVLLSLLSLVDCAVTGDKTPAQKVSEAKDTLETLIVWFNDHKMTATELKLRSGQLTEIENTLKELGAPKEPASNKVRNLKATWEDQKKNLEKHINNVKLLQSELDDLKAKIAELEKSNKNARAAFEEYKSRFTRSAELEEYGNPDDLTVEELEAVEANLKARKRDLAEEVERFESNRSDRYQRDTTDDNGDYIEPPRTAKPDSANSGNGKKSSSSSSASANEGDSGASLCKDEKGQSAVAGWACKVHGDNNSVIESDLKLKFGIEADQACDSTTMKWCIYSDWKTCQTKGPQSQSVGFGYGECKVGRTTFLGQYYVAKKADGNQPRWACTTSCYSLNNIIRAMRQNYLNGYCTWPLILSTHWDVSSVLGNLSTIVGNYVTVTLLADKLIVTNSDGDYELPTLTKETIVECCSGYLADKIGSKHTFYDGFCLCKANKKNIEKRIKDTLTESYTSAYSKWHYLYSVKTLSTIGVVCLASVASPGLGFIAAITAFFANAYGGCSLKNYHTLYIGDSSSKQIYTSLYMTKGDCFTLGELTFELINVDDTYKYKQVEQFPASFTTLCTDIDWGCGLSEGSKVCNDYNKDCKSKCDSTPGAIYREHCLATTTFHGDGCYGFMVQDHSVSVHGGVCLLTNSSKPYVGYAKIEGTESRTLTFRVSSFDQSKEIKVNVKDQIYSEPDFTIQDMAIEKDRLPVHILDAGQTLCSYTDVSGNDFCHTFTDDTSKLSNQGCVNIEWTFLSDDAKWQIEDTSAIITPYIYDIYEVCDFASMTKDGKVITVAPTGINVAFKIDSQYKTTAFTVQRCSDLTVGSTDVWPGYVERVQTTVVSVFLTSSKDCYVSLKLSACSLININYCKISKSDTACQWTVYCPVVQDIEAVLIGDTDLSSFNFTSGKHSAPTLEYSRTLFTTAATSTGAALTSIATATTKALGYLPGWDSLVSLLNFRLDKFLIPLAIIIGFLICVEIRSKEGVGLMAIIAWVYFFTNTVHAATPSMEVDFDSSLRLWHLAVIFAIGLINWSRLVMIICTFVCRRASGFWRRNGFDNFVIGVPVVDWCLWTFGIMVFPFTRVFLLTFTFTRTIANDVYRMIRFPQSDLFNTEQLDHSPIAAAICRYASRSSEEVDNRGLSLCEQVFMNAISATTLDWGPIGEGIGMRLYNSPGDGDDEADCQVDEFEWYEDSSAEQYHSTASSPIEELSAPTFDRQVSESSEISDTTVKTDSTTAGDSPEVAKLATATGTDTIVIGEVNEGASTSGDYGVMNPIVYQLREGEDPEIRIGATVYNRAAIYSQGVIHDDGNVFYDRNSQLSRACADVVMEEKLEKTGYYKADPERSLLEPNEAGKKADEEHKARSIANAEAYVISKVCDGELEPAPKKSKSVRFTEAKKPNVREPKYDLVCVVLHKMLIKHTAALVKEIKRCDRTVSIGPEDGYEVWILLEPEIYVDRRTIFADVAYNPAYAQALHMNKKEFREYLDDLKKFEGPTITRYELKDTKLEPMMRAVVGSFVADYNFDEFGQTIKRYYIHVPYCAGFESLEDRDVPYCVIVPKGRDDAQKRIMFTNEVDRFKILIVGTTNKLPSSWVKVCSVYIKDPPFTRKVVFKDYPVAEHAGIIGYIKSLNKDPKSIAVADVENLVVAVNVTAANCRRRSENQESLLRPNIRTVVSKLEAMDTVNVHCCYYTNRLDRGDFVKLSVGKYVISVYNDTLSSYLDGDKRDFICFTHSDRSEGFSTSTELGQLTCLWPTLKPCKIKGNNYCERVEFGDNNTVINVIYKGKPSEGFNLETCEKGLTQAISIIECEGIHHLYVVLPDFKGRKFINMLTNALVNKYTTLGVELTLLCGVNNDVQTVTKHVHVNLGLLSNGEEIKFDSSISVPEENNRRDKLTKKVAKEVADISKEIETAQIYSLKIVSRDDDKILLFKRGKIEKEGWFIVDNELTFQAFMQNNYTLPKAGNWGRRQWWAYDVCKGKIVGMLPRGSIRPKHFGIVLPGSRIYGNDITGDYCGVKQYAPICGNKDANGRCTYKTYPMVKHGGGLVPAIYTTEVSNKLGKPFVFSKYRLMSGCEVFVTPPSFDSRFGKAQAYVSSGFITQCSPAKVAGLSGYLHTLESFTSLRLNKSELSHLNKHTLVSLKAGRIEECLDNAYNPESIDLTSYGNVPAPDIDDVVTDEIDLEPASTALDPQIVDQVVTVDKTIDEDEEDWWVQWRDFNFVEACSDPSYARNVPPNNSMFGTSNTFGGHPLCSEKRYDSTHYPADLPWTKGAENTQLFARETASGRYCSPACAFAANSCFSMRVYNKFLGPYAWAFDPDRTINEFGTFFKLNHNKMVHPCLPELERLYHALNSPNFNRVRMYDEILDGSDSDEVFIGFQERNRKRFMRLCKETDAMCSDKFDYPDTFNGTTWVPPPFTRRTLITYDCYRTSCLGVYCTQTLEDDARYKPLVVRPKYSARSTGRDFYVALRRACVLLLAQGWNYFDVIIDPSLVVEAHKLVCAITFSMEFFGTHAINVVTSYENLRLEFAQIPQMLANPNLAPKELAYGSDFIWKRGVKTAAITESICNWWTMTAQAWEGVDVARLGLSREDCPDIVVDAENRPSFMSDGMFAIWNMTNGIMTGTCFSSGMDVVGANHCTKGNTICVEAATSNPSVIGCKRANWVNKLVKSYEGGDIDMHNNEFSFAPAKKGEIYCAINPSQQRGRWLMCTGVAEYEPTMQATYNKFVPVNIDFLKKLVELAPYKMYKGLSGAPIISSKGAVVGVYGLSTNVHYKDASLSGIGRDTTLYHSMVADNTSESENYFVEAAKELCAMQARVCRRTYLEAPTGTGKSTLFPLAVINTICTSSRLTSYSVCMLEPTRAAVHNCYERVVALLNKQSDKWKRTFTVRLATGKRGQMEGEHHKSLGAGKIQLCVMTYGRFIAEYRASSEVPHNHDMLLMDEIHTRSKDTDVATAYLLSCDNRTENVKVCYMTATSVGRVCDVRLCEGKDLQGTRYKIAEEFLVETTVRGKDKTSPAILADNTYFTIDLRAAKLNLRTKAQFVSWPKSAMTNGRCLVFLPSRNDCEKFTSWARRNYPEIKNDFVSLHAGSSVADLTTLPANAIIGCTDFASTAITVPNCRCVVDFMEDWSPTVTLIHNDVGFTYRNVIAKEVVSKQVSTQRKGRTGRTCDGTYFACSSIHTIEETKLSESMYAQVYFNLLIKMGRPSALKSYVVGSPEFDRVFEHDWLEPDNLSLRWLTKRTTLPAGELKSACDRFCIRAADRLEVIRDWDKDQLWWYLCSAVGMDYLDFCMSSENVSTHGFGVSSVKVHNQLRDNWTIIPTEEKASEIREALNFKVESYSEDMFNFDNYAQRAHDVVGAIDLHTLAKRIQKTSPKMLKSIDPAVLAVSSDATEEVVSEATESVEVNHESMIGISLGAVAAAGAIGALASAGLFAYNHRADWNAIEVYTVEKSGLAAAVFCSMIDYSNKISFGCPADKEPTISALGRLIDWLKVKWHSLSAFVKNLLKGIISFRDDVATNHESGDVILAAILKHLTYLRGILIGIWYRYGAINLSGAITSFGLGLVYNRMCDCFGVVFSNAIIGLLLAISSVAMGSTVTAINAVTMIVSYVINGCWTYKPTVYGETKSMRAGALLLTAGGGAALSILLKGSFLSKPIATSIAPNFSNGMLAMINPYNTGVNRVSDGVIIAKMVASLCRQGTWSSMDTAPVIGTLMSMLFRADAMTCMVSMTAGLFLGFARLYMANTDFWFKMTSAGVIKNNDTFKDLMQEQLDRFDKVFETILFSAGVLANPMSLVSIVANIMADITIAYMREPSESVPVWQITKEAAVYHSGVSMIYGLSSAILKVCMQLKESVSRNFESGADADIFSVLMQLRKIWDAVSFTNIWTVVKEKCSEIFNLNFESSGFDLMEALRGIWNPIHRFVKACYDWCVEKINVLCARFSKSVSDTIKNALPFVGNGAVAPSRISFKRGVRLPLQDAFWKKAAHAFYQRFEPEMDVDEISHHMRNRTACSDDTRFTLLGDQWPYMCGIAGWAIEKYAVDPSSLFESMGVCFGSDCTDNICESKYWNFRIRLHQSLHLVTGKSYLEIAEASEGKFRMVAGSNTVSGVADMLADDPLEPFYDTYADIDQSPRHKRVTTVKDENSPEGSVDTSPLDCVITDLEYLISQTTSQAHTYSWLQDMRLYPTNKEELEHYQRESPLFWLKERLQDTRDRNVIPLLVQAMNNQDEAFGPIPNIICDLGSDIYVTQDGTYGSGDYIFGELKRPWDVMRMDNAALCKLLSIVNCCTDHGTHVSLTINMSNSTVLVLSIAHSYTDKVANTGLLCQLQDSETKQVVKDIAAVEIVSWATPAGYKMLGTCPVNTAGAWDLIYGNILETLPFFRDLKTRYLPTAAEAKAYFEAWADLAAPIQDDTAFSEFNCWREKFVARRFAPMSYWNTIKGATKRRVSKLAADYDASLQESKQINRDYSDYKNYRLMCENIGYTSYYRDFAEVVHSRRGDVLLSPGELPSGVEDVRIRLNEYALGCWFSKLIVCQEATLYDCYTIRVSGDRIDPKKNLHHPAAFYPTPKINMDVNFKWNADAKKRLVLHGYLCGYNVIFASIAGSDVSYEISACAGTCRCSVVYLMDGFKLVSAASYRCLSDICDHRVVNWTAYSEDRNNDDIGVAANEALQTIKKTGGRRADDGSGNECTSITDRGMDAASIRERKNLPGCHWNHESDSWLSVLTIQSATDAFNLARAAADEFLENQGIKQFAANIKKVEDDVVEAVFGLPDSKRCIAPDGESVSLKQGGLQATESPDKALLNLGDTNMFGEPLSSVRHRRHRTRVNRNKQQNDDYDAASRFFLTPGTQKMFAYKKELGDSFFAWLRDLAIAEKCNSIIPKDDDATVITAPRAAELRRKYGLLVRDELMYIKMMGEEVKDINDYFRLVNWKDTCDEAPWCDGWDKIATHARKNDFWLTDGNMGMYTPHDIDDHIVVKDIVRVNKMIDHCPKEVWENCRYKGRMQLPNRESEIGNVYASRAACKAQLLYDYLPGFWNNHKTFFEPCCGFGGFAQFFSHQMRNMEPRHYLVSSMNKGGHAQPNWSLMQAADSNCKVVRVLQDCRDGNICDPAVLDGCCKTIVNNKVTMLIFDIGERHSDPNRDDAWYLVPRNVKGGFDPTEEGWKHGHSICGAIETMVKTMADGSDALFKINTFSMRVTDIIHKLSRSFMKVRALKLATTPEMSREFYLFCSNKKTGWEAPLTRSIKLKNCIRELTWSAMFRAENMYRTKGRHAPQPATYKWFTPDTSGISYKLIPNESSEKDELDVSTLPQGHAIHIATTTPRGAVKVDLEFKPDWDRRFRCMRDYVQKVNRVSKTRTNKGRDSIKFNNVVRSDFTFVKGIGSFEVRQKNMVEKHTANDLISNYMNKVAGLNMINATYGHTQGTAEFVKPALKRRLDVQPGQPDPTCVIDFAKAVHCLMSEAGHDKLGQFRFMSKEETYAMIVKTGSTGILDPGSTLKEFMEIYPEWYELAWSHVLEPHTKGAPTPSYQSVRIKPEPKGRKDVEDGQLVHKKGTTMDELKAGNSLSPRFIQFSDALSRIAHIIAFGHVLEYHGKKKLYKGSINGTPPHIQGRVMRAYWDLHNPYKKRVVHVGNNKELDISVEPTPGYLYKPKDSEIKPLDIEGRLGSSIYDESKTSAVYEADLPAGLTIDFSALDSTVTVSERMIMTDLWKRFFREDQEKAIIEGLCRDMTYAICLDDTGNIWVRDGQRGSGEILTSIENTWLVTANIVCALSHALGISIEDLTATQGYVNVLTRPGGCGSPKVDVRDEIRKGAHHKRFEFGDIPLLVDGDDVVIISTRRRVDQIQTYMNGNHQWLACNRKVIRSGNKGGATRYLEFEGLSFCSHRYEAVFVGPNASKYNPKFMPRGNEGRKFGRGDILSVAEDNDFKIYFLPIRPVADIMSKLMLTLKVKSLKWDPTKTGPGECVDLTQSKIISYLLLYPQCRWVRYTCLTLLCVTGDNLATFIELRKRYRDLGEMDLRHTSKLLGSMASLYGVSSLDDISLREYYRDTAEIRKLYYNTRLTGNVCNVTRATWLEASFNWLGIQRPSDVYPLMWDSAVFKLYKTHCDHNTGDNVNHLRGLLVQTGFTGIRQIENNKDGLWARVLDLVG